MDVIGRTTHDPFSPLVQRMAQCMAQSSRPKQERYKHDLQPRLSVNNSRSFTILRKLYDIAFNFRLHANKTSAPGALTSLAKLRERARKSCKTSRRLGCRLRVEYAKSLEKTPKP